MFTLWQVMTAVAASSGGAIGDMKRPPGAQRTTTCAESSECSSACVRVSPSSTAVVFRTRTVTRAKPPTSWTPSSAVPWEKATGGPGAGSSMRCASPPCRKCTVAVTSAPAVATHCSRTRWCVCGLLAAYAGG